MKRERAGDEWYETEDSTRRGMVSELQRIRRRLRARPVPVLALATVVATSIVYLAATHRAPIEAEIVLALTEGNMSTKSHDAIPVDDLRQYVDGVLIPDGKLGELIERRDLYPLRARLGLPYAIEKLRGQIEIAIWKNTFTSYEEGEGQSARIGITVADRDGDRAYDLARDLAAIVMDTAREHRQEVNARLAAEIGAHRDGLVARLAAMSQQTAAKQAELLRARARRDEGVAQALALEIVEIDHEQKSAEKDLADIAASQDALADRIAAAGLDTKLAIVEEHRPQRSEHRGFVIAMVAIVIAVGSLIGSALVIGAFDSRVHDSDDVARLGLPLLGSIPSFRGDHVGSLAARGAARARLTTAARWRSHR
ncbi:MAG TPA: hypothetical protein VMJ10_12345 [Kofleriaceae bacterium]|nr:hypothetical protein [Kofleriaceae bacterium]